jgi:hypothetical protein
MLGEFNAKLEAEDILKPTNGSDIRYKNNNDNGVRNLNVATK